ncbi:MAG: hypothetical protein ACD_49C00009G0037 [uncultured bacterium (gcode 4)]|uniref:Uncharacterized protein n=1 Tax=uncultured bacterium (gcode 4) TaxID=1234023 RepID=K2AYI5_9BACT|nr:MAG: hypothetical protein ACD_49C00009G0037 [uncultured bacterium (gcode 4)]
MKNNLDTHIFKDSADYKTLENILESLDHIKPKFISRQVYNSKKWDILSKTWFDKYWDFYDLYLPEDLKVWEQLYIINLLNKKFNLERYSKIDEIISKTKVIVWVITRVMWDNSEEYLKSLSKEYGLDVEILKKISKHKLVPNKETKDFIRQIKSQTTSKKLKTEEDFEVWTSELSRLFSKEFSLTFFRKWINMLRLWMETITQAEQEGLIWKKWKIVLHDETENLDEKERLLRDKILIDDLKEILFKIRETWRKDLIEEAEIKVTNTIIWVLFEYPYQLTENDYGFQPNKILSSKEIYCIWYSLLWHAFLSELGISHKWLIIPGHSALEVNIWWKKYFFDPSKANQIIQFEYWRKVWIYKKIKSISDSFSFSNFGKSWNVEEVLLSQIYINKWYYSLRKTEALKMYDRAIELNPRINWAYNIKWIILWKNKASKLYEFTGKLLVWKEDYIEILYRKEKKKIKELVKNRDYEGLRDYLLSFY